MISNKPKYDCQGCLFHNLNVRFISEEEFEKLRKTSQQLQFKKGEVILKQGAKPDYMLFLHKGVVKFNYESDSGKNSILTIVSGPKLLGGANLFFKETNLFSLVAVEDCEVCLIDGYRFKNILINHGRLLMFLFEKSSEMFQESIFNCINLIHKQVHGRVADILIYLSSSVYKNSEFELTLTRKEIAEFAACSHENVISTLSKFNKEGIIKVEGKHLTINNMDKLYNISRRG